MLHVQIVQAFKAVCVRATQLAYLTGVDLGNNHVCKALSAEVVLTARQESELVAKEASHADPTVLLFHVKLAPEGKLSSFTRQLQLLSVLKLNRDLLVFILYELVWVLFKQCWDQLILDRAHHLINRRTVFHPALGEF